MLDNEIQLKAQKHAEPHSFVRFSMKIERTRHKRVARHRDVEGYYPPHDLGYERLWVEGLEVEEQARRNMDLCSGVSVPGI